MDIRSELLSAILFLIYLFIFKKDNVLKNTVIYFFITVLLKIIIEKT